MIYPTQFFQTAARPLKKSKHYISRYKCTSDSRFNIPNSLANSLFCFIVLACSMLIRPVMPRSARISFSFLICCCGESRSWNTFDQTLRTPQARIKDYSTQGQGDISNSLDVKPKTSHLQTLDSFFILAQCCGRLGTFLFLFLTLNLLRLLQKRQKR